MLKVTLPCMPVSQHTHMTMYTHSVLTILYTQSALTDPHMHEMYHTYVSCVH